MPEFVIERDVPGAGRLTEEEIRTMSLRSLQALSEIGSKIQWLHSYVTADKIFCVYKSENIELIKEHAKKGGFPANAIYEVSTVISPATAK